MSFYLNKNSNNLAMCNLIKFVNMKLYLISILSLFLMKNTRVLDEKL